MNNKYVVNSIIVVLGIALLGAFVYFRVQSEPNCESVLEKYQKNHACIMTSRGTMVFELYEDAAPKSVEHLAKLSNQDTFFDGMEFYRVAKDFVIQGGIQDFRERNSNINTFDEKTAKKIKLSEEKIDTEANFSKLNLTEDEKKKLIEEKFISNEALNSRVFEYGALSFANAGPGTNSTEIFIVTATDKNSESMKFLNGRFTNMGKIVAGEDVLKTINSVESDESNPSSPRPLVTVEIKEIRVKR